MTKKIIALAAAIGLFGMSGAALAQNTMAPGQQMQEKGLVKGTTGASGYAPGQQMQRTLHQADRRARAAGCTLHVVGERVGVERIEAYRGRRLEQTALHLAVDPWRKPVLGIPDRDAESAPNHGRAGEQGQGR